MASSSKTDFASKYAFAFESSSSSDEDDTRSGFLGVTNASVTQPVVQPERKEEAPPSMREAAGEADGLKSYYFVDEDGEDKGDEG